MSGGPCPAPALAPDLPARVREGVLDVVASGIDTIATSERARRVTFRRTPLAPAADSVVLDPLMRRGFLDVSLATQVIDLAGRTEADLWRDVRHGHRADIRKGEREVRVTVEHGAGLDERVFEAYVELHRRAAGRVTRPRRTFDLMARWVRQENAALFMAWRGDLPVASALIILYRDGAFYASAANDPEHKLPAGHAIQWTAIRWMRERGVRRYDIGLQVLSDLPHAPASEKERRISLFKRGFGGRTVALRVFERYYDPVFYRQEMTARAERYALILGST
jgi:hypothetical protein